MVMVVVVLALLLVVLLVVLGVLLPHLLVAMVSLVLAVRDEMLVVVLAVVMVVMEAISMSIAPLAVLFVEMLLVVLAAVVVALTLLIIGAWRVSQQQRCTNTKKTIIVRTCNRREIFCLRVMLPFVDTEPCQSLWYFFMSIPVVERVVFLRVKCNFPCFQICTTSFGENLNGSYFMIGSCNV